MAELVSTRYSTVANDISAHINKIAGIIGHLRSMETMMDATLVISTLASSTKVAELCQVTASIRPLSDADINWEAVSSRLIEEARTLNQTNGPAARAITVETRAEITCQICCKKGHRTLLCFLNPTSPNCRITASKEQVDKILNGKQARE